MASSNIFHEYLKPARNVTDYMADFDKLDSNRLELAAKRRTNAEADQANVERNAIRAAMAAGADFRTPEGLSAILKAAGASAPAVAKTFGEIGKMAAETYQAQQRGDNYGALTGKTNYEVTAAQGKAAAQHMLQLRSPTDAIESMTARLKTGELKPAAFQALIAQMPHDQAGFDDWKVRMSKAVDPASADVRANIEAQVPVRQSTVQLNTSRAGLANAQAAELAPMNQAPQASPAPAASPVAQAQTGMQNPLINGVPLSSLPPEQQAAIRQVMAADASGGQANVTATRPGQGLDANDLRMRAAAQSAAPQQSAQQPSNGAMDNRAAMSVGGSQMQLMGSGGGQSDVVAPPVQAQPKQLTFADAPPGMNRNQAAKWISDQNKLNAAQGKAGIIRTTSLEDPNNSNRTIVVDANKFNLDRYMAGDKTGFIGFGPKLTQNGAAEQKLALDLPAARLRVKIIDQNYTKLEKALLDLHNDKGLTNITGGIMGRLPSVSDAGTGAQAKLNSILSNIFQSSLQAMRESSKTGGAVGNVSDKEGDKLQNTIAGLNQFQGTADFKTSVMKAVDQVRLSKKLIREAFDEQFAGVQNAPFNGQPPRNREDGISSASTTKQDPLGIR